MELGIKCTAWVRGATDTKTGTAIVTTQWVAFFDEKFAANTAFGAIGGHRRRPKAPRGGRTARRVPARLDLGAREKKLLNKDRIRSHHAERPEPAQRRVGHLLIP